MMKKLQGIVLLLCLCTACASTPAPTPEVQPFGTDVSPQSSPEELEELEEEPEEEPEEPLPEKQYLNHQEEGGEFELPLWGACGFVAQSTPLYDTIGGAVLTQLSPGQGFTILQEEDSWWQVAIEGEMGEEGKEGWLSYRHCMINLPDILPSIIYENPYANLCTSCSLGKDIPNVTGHQLYEALFYHPRYEEERYLTPVYYETAKKINKIQQRALSEGNSLLIYECFRPATVQNRLVTGLAQLMSQDSEVNTALTTAPWSKSWFVSTGVSSHQRGIAVDMTLVTVLARDTAHSGDYAYEKITQYMEKEMPTQFDELSPLAATFTGPSSSRYAPTMTESAILLQEYCTQVGLIPLASEWWHFKDSSGGENFLGEFLLTENYGHPPLAEGNIQWQ